MPESSPDRSRFNVSHHETLLVDNLNKPLNFPLAKLNLHETVRALTLDRAEVVKWSDLWIRGFRQYDRLPDIMRLRGYRQDISQGIIVPLSRYNLFIRDDGRCQYTGKKLEWDHPEEEFRASVDHVIPVSYGGRTEWRNLVLCSALFNSTEKRDRTLKEVEAEGYQLISQPWEPTAADMLSIWATSDNLARFDIPISWQPYIREVTPTVRVQRIRAGEFYAA